MSDAAVAPAVAAPATQKAPKKAANAKKPADHPKYAAMIKDALSALKERGGSSRVAVLKYIMTHNNLSGQDEKTVNAHLKLALRAGVKAGTLKQSKGTGATGSFKIGVDKEPKKAKVAKKPKEATKTKKPKEEKKPKDATVAAAAVQKPKVAKKPKATGSPVKKPQKAATGETKKPKAAKKSPTKPTGDAIAKPKKVTKAAAPKKVKAPKPEKPKAEAKPKVAKPKAAADKPKSAKPKVAAAKPKAKAAEKK